MKAKIIPIGNSQGIRIPKTIIEQCGFDNYVEMEVKDGSLVLTPIKNIREGWSESFQSMAVNGDDQLLIDDALGTVSDEDWEW
ncbi:MAG: AbrB/MazE/SpoVT family DNA-binding domain-containing protein [Cyanobacteria bacterium P01_G01_bin.67]